MFHHNYHFSLFKNKEIDSLYFTSALVCFGEGLVSIFIPIYFWKLGFPLWKIIFFFFLNSSYFITLSFLLLPILRRLSDKMMMFLSIPFIILHFWGLGIISDQPWLFYILPGIWALAMLFYNVGYHIDFTCSSDDSCLGKEVGLSHTINLLVQFSAPALGGVLISLAGFQNSFFYCTLILLLAILPLFFFPKRKISSSLNSKTIFSYLNDKNIFFYHMSAVGYAAETNLSGIIWALFLFLSVGDIEKFGGIVSLGLLAGAVINFLVGYFSDKGERRRILSISAILYSFVWFLRSILKSAWSLATSNVVGHVFFSSLSVSWSSQFYKIARAVKDPSSFILGQIILYHVCRSFFLPILMFLSIIFKQEIFFKVCFLIAIVSSSFFIFANKTHTSNLSLTK